jgi:hypothetical protein
VGSKPSDKSADDTNVQSSAEVYVRRHMKLGWWSILVFLTLGISLELMHGFKVDWYLNVGNETRRLMWNLAHAHGVLVGVLHIAFAMTVGTLAADARTAWRRPASVALTGATILLPGGFLLGGIWIYAGDPGRGVLLVPVGAALLFASVFLTAGRVTRW